MSIFRSPTPRSQPRPIGILAALLSLASVIFLIVFIETSSSALIKKLSINQLDAQPGGASGEEGSLISALIDPISSPFSYAYRLIRGETNQIGQRETILEPVRLLKDMLLHLSQRRLKLALNIAHKLMPDDSPLMREVAESSEILTQIASQLEQAIEQSSLIDRQRKELDTLMEKGTKIRDRYNLIADQFGTILSLRSIHALNGDLPTYQEGVLQGLPSIETIPDGLADLVELREWLEKLGGGVKVSGTNQNEAFSKVLSDLRSATEQIQSEFSFVTDATNELSKHITQASSALTSLLSEVEGRVNQLLSLVISHRVGREPNREALIPPSISRLFEQIGSRLAAFIPTPAPIDKQQPDTQQEDQADIWVDGSK